MATSAGPSTNVVNPKVYNFNSCVEEGHKLARYFFQEFEFIDWSEGFKGKKTSKAKWQSWWVRNSDRWKDHTEIGNDGVLLQTLSNVFDANAIGLDKGHEKQKYLKSRTISHAAIPRGYNVPITMKNEVI